MCSRCRMPRFTVGIGGNLVVERGILQREHIHPTIHCQCERNLERPGGGPRCSLRDQHQATMKMFSTISANSAEEFGGILDESNLANSQVCVRRLGNQRITMSV